MRKWLLPAMIIACAVLVSIVVYADLPQQMVIHFNSQNEADNWLSRPLGAFLLPTIAVFICLIITLAMKLERDVQKRQRNEASLGTLLSAISFTLLLVHLFIIAHNLGYALSAAVAACLLSGFIFIALGNTLPRLTQSSFNRPMLSPTAERRFSRLIGRLMIATGILFLLVALLPQSLIFPIFFVLLATFIILMLSILFRYSRMHAE